MKQKVMNFIQKHRLLKSGKTVLVGVSGGPDSMALLHFLYSIQKQFQLQLYALCINHQLRGREAEREFEYVKEKCSKWDIPFIGENINVIDYKEKHNVSLQMAARSLRYQCYEKHIEKCSADYLALGHHADDQIETMFMAMSQITELATLSGIPVKRQFYSSELIRPLLCVTKDDIMSYCQTYDISPKIDPSNKDERYMRVYYRNEIVPKIKARHPNVHKTIQYLSETLQDDERYLMEEAKKVFTSEQVVKRADTHVTLFINRFKAKPISLQRRVFQLILDYLYKEKWDNLTYVHQEALFSLLYEKKSNIRIDFPKQLRVEKSYDTMLFYFDKEDDYSHFHKVIDIPTIISLPNGATLSISLTKNQVDGMDEYTYTCLLSDVTLPLHIRTRRPGDRMSWIGLNGSKKIKDIFIDEKIPRKKRDELLLITDDDRTVLWVIGVKKGLPKRRKRNDRKEQSGYYIKMSYKES